VDNCASERTGDAVFGRSVSDLLREDATSGFSGKGCCGGGAGGSENLAFMLPSLIGDILTWLIGEALTGSFLVSVERIALMYWWVC
jgi:hypothetical protein